MECKFEHNLYIRISSIVRINLLLCVFSYLIVSSLTMSTSRNM
jgi:hypothetical protein